MISPNSILSCRRVILTRIKIFILHVSAECALSSMHSSDTVRYAVNGIVTWCQHYMCFMLVSVANLSGLTAADSVASLWTVSLKDTVCTLSQLMILVLR
jgi:hypothetical protein